MALTTGTETVIRAAYLWRQRCLLDESSVFTEERLWTEDHLSELNRFYVERLDAGEGTFLEKLQTQLAPCSPGAKRLAAEMMWVLLLFPNNVSRDTKLATIRTIWEWSGERLPPDHPLLEEPLKQGVGSGGQGFNTFRWAELVFLIVLMRDWRAKSRVEQQELLGDPWRFAAWLDTVPGAQNRQFRHMLLHLLFPETFERVSSTGHKARIDSAFASLLDGNAEKGSSFLARDRRLLQIRHFLEGEYPAQKLDFYYPPLLDYWQDEEEEPKRYTHGGPPIGKVAEAPKGGESDGEGPEREGDAEYREPSFPEILPRVRERGLRIPEQTLRRYHLALRVRGFVILSGVSGTGKTWLTELYADAVGAKHLLVPVAPNWTTNEDLLGYFNPLDGQYHDTTFSRFLREAAVEHERAEKARRAARPYHLVLDEMNLARVEYYFARFLSAMEVRARNGTAPVELGPDERVQLTPNLRFIGTVNVDETTHAFADKVYDRAQLIELEASREALAAHLDDAPHADVLLHVWDAVGDVAPFAFRVVDEIGHYVGRAEAVGASADELLDEQILQKILPKLKGTDPRVGEALTALDEILPAERFPLSGRKIRRMYDGFLKHGFASYF